MLQQTGQDMPTTATRTLMPPAQRIQSGSGSRLAGRALAGCLRQTAWASTRRRKREAFVALLQRCCYAAAENPHLQLLLKQLDSLCKALTPHQAVYRLCELSWRHRAALIVEESHAAADVMALLLL